MSDLISRKAALDAIQARADMELAEVNHYYLMGFQEAAEAVESVPDAQPGLDEWCTDCKEYDHEKHCCPRWNRVIREALKDAQPEERTNERTETHACDLIDRQDAIDALEEAKAEDPFNRYEEQNIGLDWGIEAIKSLPSAQPEIIRCKDCKYNDENWRRVSVRWLPCMDVRTGSNWFCGFAERREE